MRTDLDKIPSFYIPPNLALDVANAAIYLKL